MDALDPSRIQRIVLLIDLHPLLVFEDTTPYISNVLAAARRILSFPAISSSLAAFKFFFSSLSPILSTSKLRHLLGKSPTLLSFDSPLQTLDRLLGKLNSLFSIQDPSDSDRPTCSRASLVAGSLLQLEYDYAWEPQIEDRKGMLHSLMIRSNLVVLFSPIPQSPSCLSEYLSEGALLSSDQFLRKFLQVFGLVKERLVSRDIHISWVDVRFDPLGEEERLEFSLFESGVKELGWGFNRTDAIVLGSALIPFGLIFPQLGCSMALKSSSSCTKNRAELILGIKDSSGATLMCKSCDLEFVVLKVLEEKSDMLFLSSEKCGRCSTRICIREVWQMNEVTKAIENSCALILLHGISRATGKEVAGSAKEEFIADKILKLICDGQGGLDARKPIWQLILTFLYNRNCSALVSVLDGDGRLFNGIMQPFTLNYALLSIFPGNLDVSLSAKNRANDNRRKGNKTETNLLHYISWSSFTDRVFSQSDGLASSIVLEELYFNLPVARSKKLRFLKCWMKQIMKLNIASNSERNGADNTLNVKGVNEETSSQEKSEPVSSTGDNCLGQPKSHLVSFSSIEDSNAFLESIAQKIEHALCSKEVDLCILAERLVFMSIDALYTKNGRILAEDLDPKKELDLFDTKIATEMADLLLVKPKDLKVKCKSSISASSTIETAPVIYSNEEKIRMHELQILFRMEILLSKVASNLDKCVKQKLTKDSCLLLRNVEFYLQADFFGGESLLDYATRTIKSRYEHSLRDVIHEIFTKMEFFSFDGNEAEASDSAPASNDDELRKKGDNVRMNSPNSVAMNEHNMPAQQVTDGIVEQQLMEAKRRRNRARRFSSFTSWVPDLHKLWALRHPKPEKQAPETLLPKLIRPRKRKRRSPIHDRVCETP